MGLVDKGLSALGRLAMLAGLILVFMFGMVGVVYMALQGSEIKVPEITGKDIHETERELASLGLKIKKRADRVSAEKPDTIIEQLPKAGETVKTGQMILVVTSKGGGGEGEAPPPSLKTTDEDDTEKIEEMISEKPKKAKTNSNTNRKKADTARDVDSNSSNSNSNSNTSDSTNSNKKETTPGSNSSDKNKNTQSAPTKPATPTKPNSGEPKPKATVRP